MFRPPGRLLTSWNEVEVLLQGAEAEGALVSGQAEGPRQNDVVAQRSVGQPGALTGEGGGGGRWGVFLGFKV